MTSAFYWWTWELTSMTSAYCHSLLLVDLGADQYSHSLLLVDLGADQYSHSLLLVDLGADQYSHSLLLVDLGADQYDCYSFRDSSRVLSHRLRRL
ncbi:unnamed protein product [Arctogadus glacialis]